MTDYASTYFEDYVVGSVRFYEGRTITAEDIEIHAAQTGDVFPHHVDAEWCATQPFGRPMAHGTLVLSVAVEMTADEVNPAAMSYGYDRIRFVRPVFVDDTIAVRAEVTAQRDDRRAPTTTDSWTKSFGSPTRTATWCSLWSTSTWSTSEGGRRWRRYRAIPGRTPRKQPCPRGGTHEEQTACARRGLSDGE